MRNIWHVFSSTFAVMSPIFKKLVSTLGLALVGFPIFAQGPPPPPPPPGLVVPIDDHLLVLLVLGFILGLYAVIKLKKETLSFYQ